VLAGAAAVAAFALPGSPTRVQLLPIVPAAQRPLVTAIFDPALFVGPQSAAAFRRARAAGATAARLSVSWADVAPPGTQKPAKFDQADPRDPNYRFASVDEQVKEAVAAGLEPIIDVWGAPFWVLHGIGRRPQDGPVRPSQDSFGEFVHALAARYSGRVLGLPRVRYWEAWNEPNVSIYLMPQYGSRNRPVSPDLYRDLLNEFSDAVHGVHASNVVAAGALSPFSVRNAAVDTVGPLDFLRRLLCVSADPRPHSTCRDTVSFDVLSFHPYTSGAPTHHASNANDLSLGDISKLRPILSAARQLGHLRSTGPLRFWVTEFSWNTDPPDPTAAPIGLQSRWVAEALHDAWLDGVTLFTWFTLHDDPVPQDFQSGLYFRGATFAQDRPKPTLTAFRFPFVANRRGGLAAIWGRTPTSGPGTVAVERRAGAGWQVVETFRANRYGIFEGKVRVASADRVLRAAFSGSASLAFALDPPANENLSVSPFGISSKK